MNNLEIKDDFLKLLAKGFPNLNLSERDDMLIGMAINHACLCLNHEMERLEKRIGRIDDIVRDKDYSDTEAFALILEVTENKWVEDED